MLGKNVSEEIKLLVIGAAGSGKSSLINLFYVWGRKFELKSLPQQRMLIKTKYFQGDDEAERDTTNQGESQTDFSKTYHFFLNDNQTGKTTKLVFLDTPGMGDTRGHERDEENIDDIIDAVYKTEDLNAILLVVNGSDPRINSRFKYIVTKIQGMIPDVLKDNLFVLLSNVEIKPNLKIEDVLDFSIDKEKIFTYNNQIFSLEPEAFEDDEIMSRLYKSFDTSKKTLTHLFKAIANSTVKTTDELRLFKEKKDEFKKKLAECNDREIEIHQDMQRLQSLSDEISKGVLEAADLNARLFAMVPEEYWEAIPTTTQNTSCLTCKRTCHEGCGREKIGSQGGALFKTCLAFGGSQYCKECSHHYESHVLQNEKYVLRTRKRSQIDLTLKSNLDAVESETLRKEEILKSIEKHIHENKLDLVCLYEETQTLVYELKEVCSRFDYVKEIDSLINVLVERMQNQPSELLEQNQPLHEKHMRLNSLSKAVETMKSLKAGLRQYILEKNKQKTPIINDTEYNGVLQFSQYKQEIGSKEVVESYSSNLVSICLSHPVFKNCMKTVSISFKEKAFFVSDYFGEILCQWREYDMKERNMRFSFPLNSNEIHPFVSNILATPPPDQLDKVKGLTIAVCDALNIDRIEGIFQKINFSDQIIEYLTTKLLTMMKNKKYLFLDNWISLYNNAINGIHNILSGIDRRFIYSQGKMGICYAHATAYVILEAESRIVGRKVMSFSQLVNKIVKKHGIHGGYSAEVLKEECPERRLRFQILKSIEEGKKAVLAGRPLLGSFYLSGEEWRNFSDFYRKSPKAVLTSKELYAKRSNPVRGEAGGHAVSVISYDSSKDAWIIRNSWGTDFAASGFFLLKVDAMKNFKLVDIYSLESDLSREDKSNYDLSKGLGWVKMLDDFFKLILEYLVLNNTI